MSSNYSKKRVPLFCFRLIRVFKSVEEVHEDFKTGVEDNSILFPRLGIAMVHKTFLELIMY